MTCYRAVLFLSAVVKQAAPSLTGGVVRISATADPGDVKAVVGILVFELILALFPFAIVTGVSGAALRHCVRSFLRAAVRAPFFYGLLRRMLPSCFSPAAQTLLTYYSPLRINCRPQIVDFLPFFNFFVSIYYLLDR